MSFNPPRSMLPRFCLYTELDHTVIVNDTFTINSVSFNVIGDTAIHSELYKYPWLMYYSL